MPTIGFIGGGNMASSLVGGMVSSGYSAADITVADPDAACRESLAQRFGINTCEENSGLAKCEIIVLAVKPQMMKLVCQQFTPEDAGNTLFISIAAGIRSTDINRWLADGSAGGPVAIVRCMPNTPSLLRCGASGLFANDQVDEAQRLQAENIMQAVGVAVWVEEESQLDAVTAVSGSGPAYFFLMMEAMKNAGESLGLSEDIAQQLVLQTALGAARMADEGGLSPAELRQNVTSKGGTTERAIQSLQDAGYQQIITDALRAAHDRSVSLADELGSDQ